jgi:hypothetical protein
MAPMRASEVAAVSVASAVAADRIWPARGLTSSSRLKNEESTSWVAAAITEAMIVVPARPQLASLPSSAVPLASSPAAASIVRQSSDLAVNACAYASDDSSADATMSGIGNVNRRCVISWPNEE